MYHYNAKCIHVVDGDTMDFDVDLGFHLTNRIRVRLADIDTPEIYGKKSKDPKEKDLGLMVKDFVNSLLLEDYGHAIIGVDVIICTEKTGSFGRWLATVIFKDGETLSQKIRAKFPEIK